ncbi:membrane lipoprotein lipid attachment site-containing protein [Vagococcus intermedius]|uniref:Membrane lipoprotein lipid attachment site-containing protein n=1 Tax=Vagococcus intermedius TaxID=2991418 RepID=A0AAF0CWD5_9ENTE|nr:membrane lipoprotein lipid attachment site-containing protein [Vagococcus intermedius]WEG74245.1 membrane lipoprotein lipid attachment site-containing protein [Vagococcus intermedius]WEG76327.1 membrane lipoprotein lipid attachment site-containing protein [Vagococcus intermedius]
MKKIIFLIVGLLLLTGCTHLPEAEHPPVVSSKYTKDYQKKKQQATKPNDKKSKSPSKSSDSSDSEQLPKDSADIDTRYPDERKSLVTIGGLTKEVVDTISDDTIQQSLTQADDLVQSGQLDHMTAFINDITATLDETTDSLDRTIDDMDKSLKDDTEDSEPNDEKPYDTDQELKEKDDSHPMTTPDQAVMSVVGIYGDSPEGAKYVQTGSGTDETGQSYQIVQLIPEGQDVTSATSSYRVYDNGTVSTN